MGCHTRERPPWGVRANVRSSARRVAWAAVCGLVAHLVGWGLDEVLNHEFGPLSPEVRGTAGR